MFYLDYVGTGFPATALTSAVAAMAPSKPGTYDNNLMVLAQTLALSAAYFAANNVNVNAPGYSVHVQIRGGWDNGTSTLHIEIQPVALTNTGNVRVGDPTTRVAPQ